MSEGTIVEVGEQVRPRSPELCTNLLHHRWVESPLDQQGAVLGHQVRTYVLQTWDMESSQKKLKSLKSKPRYSLLTSTVQGSRLHPVDVSRHENQKDH